MAGPFGTRVKVLDTERKTGLEVAYTVDVITYLKKNFPENDFSLLIGSDNWKVRKKWKDFDKIEEMCREIVVIGRGEDEKDGFSLPDISSTMIKTMIKEGKDPDIFLPAGISGYIRKNGLYA